jgi:hypothetical protein
MKNKKAWVIALVVSLSLPLLGAALLAWFGVRGWDLALPLLGLLVLGVVAGALLFHLLRDRSAAAPRRRDDEVELVLAAARRRLATARAGGTGKLGTLPVMLVLGPAGSTKTSVVLHSGLDPELLAGEARRDDAVVATRAANLWYAPGLVIAEAGGALLDDPARWERFVRALRPRTLESGAAATAAGAAQRGGLLPLRLAAPARRGPGGRRGGARAARAAARRVPPARRAASGLRALHPRRPDPALRGMDPDALRRGGAGGPRRDPPGGGPRGTGRLRGARVAARG